MARGLQGQAIYVDPAAETVVVKLSYVPLGNRDAFPETVAFLRAVSRWQVPEARRTATRRSLRSLTASCYQGRERGGYA